MMLFDIMPALPDMPSSLVSLDFVDTCGSEPNCFTVIDTYSSNTVTSHPAC